MAVLLSNETYEVTRKIKLGKSFLTEKFQHLSHWITEKYNVKMLNAEFGFLKESGSCRLYIILENVEDYNKISPIEMYMDTNLRRTRTAEFAAKILELKIASQKELKNFFIAFNDFSEEAKTCANWKAIGEVRSFLKEKYGRLWHVEALFSSAAIFYYTDSEIKENEINGTSEKIKADYYIILKKYDELGYFSLENLQLKFDSKENLDKNYEGSLFYYSRG